MWSLKMLKYLQKHPKILEILMIPHLYININYGDCLGKENVRYKMFFLLATFHETQKPVTFSP